MKTSDIKIMAVPQVKSEALSPRLSGQTLDEVFKITQGATINFDTVLQQMKGVEETQTGHQARNENSTPIPYVQEGLSSAWQLHLCPKDKSGPKSQGNKRRFKRKARSIFSPPAQLTDRAWINKTQSPMSQQQIKLQPRIAKGGTCANFSKTHSRQLGQTVQLVPKSLRQEMLGRQPPATASFPSTSRTAKLYLASSVGNSTGSKEPTSTLNDAKSPLNQSQNPKSGSQDQRNQPTLSKRIVGTGPGTRRVTTIGSLRDRSSVVSGRNPVCLTETGGSIGPSGSGQPSSSFVIQNMKLRNKFSLQDNYEKRFINSVERLQRHFAETQEVINIRSIPASPTSNSNSAHLNDIAYKRNINGSPFNSQVEIEQKQATDAYMKLLEITSKNDSNASSVEKVEMYPKGFLGDSPTKHKFADRVPALDFKNVHRVNSVHSNSSRAEQTSNALNPQSTRRTQNNSITLRHQKVEVINSASSAFRQLVNDKTILRRGLDPLNSYRTHELGGKPKDALNSLAFRAVSNKMAITRGKHTKQTSPNNQINVTTPRQISNKRKKGHSKVSQDNRSPSAFRNATQSSLQEPILTARKQSDLNKILKNTEMSVVDNDASLQQPAQLSTATLFNDRNLAAASFAYNTGRNTIVRDNMNQSNVSQPETLLENSILSNTLQDGASVANQAKVQATAKQLVNYIPTSNSVSTIEKGSLKTGHNTTRQRIDSMQSQQQRSPSFKQLNEMFEYMEKDAQTDIAKKAASPRFEAPPIVKIKMTDRKNDVPREEIKKRKRGKTQGDHKALFDNSKLGKMNQRQGQGVGSAGAKLRHHSHQVKANQTGDYKQNQARQQPLVGETNNLQVRFFTLRRQRERRIDSMPPARVFKDEFKVSGNGEAFQQTYSPRQKESPRFAAVTNQEINPPYSVFAALSELQENTKVESQVINQKIVTGYLMGVVNIAGSQTEFAKTPSIPAKPDGVMSARDMQQFGLELQNIIDKGSDKVLEGKEQFTTKIVDSPTGSLLKDKYRSTVIGASNELEFGIPVAHDVASFKQSSVASDTHDIPDLETLRPIIDEKYLEVSHQDSMMDDEEMDPLPAETKRSEYSIINSIEFDPKVKITGVNSGDFSDGDISKLAHMNEFEINRQTVTLTDGSGALTPLNNEVNTQTATMDSRINPTNQAQVPQQSVSPSQLWTYFKEQQKDKQQNQELPLILQQEAQRKQKEFARISKDGRITFVPKKYQSDTNTPQAQEEDQTSSQVQTQRASPLEMKISQPWQTAQQQRDEVDRNIRQMREEELRRFDEQRRKQYIVHHIQDGNQALISIRKEGCELYEDESNHNSRAPSPLNQKYLPNLRNMLLQPLLKGKEEGQPLQQRKKIITMKSCLEQATSSQNGDSVEHIDNPTTKHPLATHFQVKIPALQNKYHEQTRNSQQKQQQTLTNPIHPVTERRKVVQIPPKQDNQQQIKHGSYQLKLNSLHKDSTIRGGSVTAPNNSDFVVAGLGRFDTLNNMDNQNLASEIASAKDEGDIDTGEFTYTKQIVRDKNLIGKNLKVRELKYVPVCDISMKKRRASRQVSLETTRPKMQTPHANANKGVQKSDMATMITQDVVEEMQTASITTQLAQSDLYRRRTAHSVCKDQAQIAIINQTQKTTNLLRKLTQSGQQGTSDGEQVQSMFSEKSVFRVAYPESKSGLSGANQRPALSPSLVDHSLNDQSPSLRRSPMNYSPRFSQLSRINQI